MDISWRFLGKLGSLGSLGTFSSEMRLSLTDSTAPLKHTHLIRLRRLTVNIGLLLQAHERVIEVFNDRYSFSLRMHRRMSGLPI